MRREAELRAGGCVELFAPVEQRGLPTLPAATSLIRRLREIDIPGPERAIRVCAALRVQPDEQENGPIGTGRTANLPPGRQQSKETLARYCWERLAPSGRGSVCPNTECPMTTSSDS